MKILGQAGSTYIAEVTNEELAQILGYRSSWQAGKGQQRQFRPGEEINVHEAYRRLSEIDSIRKELAAAAAKTMTVAKRFVDLAGLDSLGPIAPHLPE